MNKTFPCKPKTRIPVPQLIKDMVVFFKVDILFFCQEHIHF